jgi:zinc protease
VRDTARHSAEELDAWVEGLGGSLSEYCGNNSFGLGLETLADDAPEAADRLVELLTENEIRNRTFARERDAQIAQIRESLDDVFEEAKLRHRQLFFGRHPFANDSLGHEESLRTVTREALVEYRNRWLVGSNLVIAVSGQFDEAEIESRLTRGLSGLPVGQPPLKPAPAPWKPEAIAQRLQREREQAIYLLGFPDRSLLDEHYVRSDLLDEILSGMSSELFNRVREEKGMAYFVGASRLVGLPTGMFYLYAGTRPDQVDALREEVNQELRRLADAGPTDQELARAVSRLKAQRDISGQAAGSRAMHAALNALYGREINDRESYLMALRTTTVGQLRDYAKTLFDPHHAVELVVSP